MARSRPEPLQVVKQRRDAALKALVDGVPYIGFLGVAFERRGDELTSVMPFDEMLIGNPQVPALHGGATAAFLEITAIIGLSWTTLWEEIESGRTDPETLTAGRLPRLPKTIDFTVDYLRSLRSTARGGAMPACMSRRGRTIAAAPSHRPRAIS
jgi:acyl-coenzyme A thioesterase PaaI-like protein